MGKILVVGSFNMDQVVHVPRIPALGETLLCTGSPRLVPGGKGANQAVAIARAGGQVAMAGRVGNDPFGTQLVQALEADAIGTGLIDVDTEEASGTAFVLLGPDGDNAIVVSSGANGQVGKDEEQMARIFAAMQEASTLVMQLEIPLATVEQITAYAYTLGLPVTLNLAPAQQLPSETLQQISVLIVNEGEASLLSRERVESVEDAERVARRLHDDGVAMVVVTLGARGALLVTSDQQGATQSIYQAAPQVKVVDTTAAGDCFVGALTVALAEGQGPEEALRFAVSASALKVTRFGAQSGLPTREEIFATYHS